MAKSKILKELANNEISLEIALQRLLIISSDINDNNLFSWCENELNGYFNEEIIPPYRKVHCPHIIYTGINGTYKMTKTPFPITAFPPKIQEEIINVDIKDGIYTIEKYANINNQNTLSIDLTFLASYIYNTQHIKCTSIQQLIPQETFEEVINKIKTIIMKVLIKLDKTYGNLDNLDLNTDLIKVEEINETKTVINNYIYNNNSITIGNGNAISKSEILSGGSK